MANIDGLPVNSAVTHAEFMARTEDTSTTGKVDFNNTTDSTTPANGSIHTAGGIGVEKSLNVGLNASVSGELIVAGETTLNDTLNASNINAVNITSDTLLTSGNIVSSGGSISGGNISAAGAVTSLLSVSAPQINAGDIDATGDLSAATINTTGDVTVGGNLVVQGTVTTIESTNVSTVDKNITINQGGNDTSSEGAGLTVDRAGTDGSLIYKDASATKWAAGSLGSEVDLVGTTSTQTLTNKTLSGSSNTITDVPAGNLSGVVAIGNGGTGQTTQSAAFNALSPLTTKGDLVVSDGSTNARLAVGTDTFVLTADSSQPSGVKWAALSGSTSAQYLVFARNSSGQAIATATQTTITNWTETTDTNNDFNNSTGVWTCSSDGKYIFIVTITFSDSVAAGDRSAFIRDVTNSVDLAQSIRPFYLSGSGQTTQTVVACVDAVVGRQISIQCSHTAGSNQSLVAVAQRNTLTILKA